jgi:hypothetical protein
VKTRIILWLFVIIALTAGILTIYYGETEHGTGIGSPGSGIALTILGIIELIIFRPWRRKRK